MSFRLFLDSGAPTLYHKYARKKVDKGGYMGAYLKDRKHDDFSWLDNPEYLEYRDKYVEYIKKHESSLEVYTNLDIVNNPKATWDNQKYFESHGLKPMPVWHFGSDYKWLLKYLDKGYEYIGIGGLVPNPYTTLRPALDEIFSKFLCDSRGMPVVKVHGFAATSIRLMCRYPWYSVDSASWVKYAAFGGIMVPQKVRGEYRYTIQPHKVNVSWRSPAQKSKDLHINTLGKALHAHVTNYIREQGFELGESRFETNKKTGKIKEIVVTPGLSNRPHLRAFFNALYYIGLKNQLPKWPWAFKIQGLSLL